MFNYNNIYSLIYQYINIIIYSYLIKILPNFNYFNQLYKIIPNCTQEVLKLQYKHITIYINCTKDIYKIITDIKVIVLYQILIKVLNMIV